MARGLYVYAGSVTLDHLTIADAVARGGDGITGVDGGGGAGGLGGGLFIAQTGSVTLSSVNFLNDSAIGGNGGAFVGPGNVGTVIGASGGFGFGGRGGLIGGSGGFGAGGGAGSVGGAGGFGAGNGGAGPFGAGGGGGLGAGGAIFVHSGGSLALQSGTIGAGGVAGGLGGAGAGNGQALGATIFLSGNQSFSLAPPAGQTIEIDGVIADTIVPGEPAGVVPTYSGGDSSGYFSGGVVTTIYQYYYPAFGFTDPFVAPQAPLPAPGGTARLNGANTYTSGTNITGTLDLATATSAGTGTITFAAENATLRVHGTTMPANILAALSPAALIDLPDIQATPGVVTVTGGTQHYDLPLAGGGTATLRDTIGAADLAAIVTLDGSGGSQIGFIYEITANGVIVPQATRAYTSVGRGLAFVTTPVIAGALGATGAVTLHGGASDGGLVISGTEDLTFRAGTGAGTVIAGGGNNRYEQLGGAGDQTFLLGNGADTIFAFGNATVDGNAGGKLILLGAGNDLILSHATSAAADTVMGGSGNASVVSHGNAILSGFSGSINLTAAEGVTTLFAGSAPATVAGAGTNAGNVIVTTNGSLVVYATNANDLVLGGGADTRILYYDYTQVGLPHAGGIVSGGAGSVTVAANGGEFLGGTAGNNHITMAGVGTMVGGGAGDVLAFTGGAGGIAFASSGATTMDGGAGGDVTLVAGMGGGDIITGNAHSMVWLSGGDEIVAAEGADTIVAGAGAATVTAAGPGVLLFAGSGALDFRNTGAVSTVVGGAGAMTVHGGSGGGLFFGSGGDVLLAESGAATLVGGGAGDVLSITGGGYNLLVGGGGAETLGGALATGVNAIYAGTGPDLLIGGAGLSYLFAGSGGTTLQGGSAATDFVFRHGMAGGQVAVTSWNPGLDSILLQSYPAGEAASALAGASHSGGNTLLTLSDGTAITFVGVNTLSAANFL